MNSLLLKRLAALEAIAPPADTPNEPRTDYAALRASLDKRIERSRAPAPSGLAGVRHYRQKIITTRTQAEESPSPAHGNPLRTDFHALRIFAAQKDCERNFPGTRHELRRCELEVLAAIGFNHTRLALWRHEHDEYARIPWQWHGADLPDDALAVIEAALASENSEGIHDEHDEEAE